MKKGLIVTLSILISVVVGAGAVTGILLARKARGDKGNQNAPQCEHVYDRQVVADDYLESQATCINKAKYFYSCVCGEKGELTFEYGELIDHEYTELKHNETEHWYECNCGDKTTAENHKGGTATCTKKANCEICGEEHGGLKDHKYTEIKHNETEHWYECTCGDRATAEGHKGGTATCTEKAICEICDQTYGKLIDHKYTKLKHNETEHWYECTCGDRATAENHKGGTATCTEKAICEICDQTYGKLKEHKYTKLKHNETEHWYECNCGDKATAEGHKGGTATCTEKAICEICDQTYGELKEHDISNEWVITETHHYKKCKNTKCTKEFNYGEHKLDQNKKCLDCGHVPEKYLFTITWINFDGTILETDEKVQYGTIPTYNGITPTKEKDVQYSYEFSKWAPSIVAVTESKSYVAQYNPVLNKFTVNFADYDGYVLDSQLVEYGSKPVEPINVERNGYEFSGWNTEPDGTGTQYNDVQTLVIVGENAKDVTLYAQWTVLPFEISSYVGEGSVVRDSNSENVYVVSFKSEIIYDNAKVILDWRNQSFTYEDIVVSSQVESLYVISSWEKAHIDIDIQITNEHAVDLYLLNLNMVGSVSAQNQLNVYAYEKNRIVGSGEKVAILGDNVCIFGNGTLEVEGGAGYSYTGISNYPGGDGKAAIECSILKVDFLGNLSLKGGDGGIGSNGTNGRSSSSASISHGGRGGDGGNGAPALICTTDVSISCLALCAVGGNGGNGGHGGNGGNITGCSYSGVPKAGNGGAGGHGGDGAHAIVASKIVSGNVIIIYLPNSFDCDNMTFKAGDGGNGGNGGRGGNGTFDFVHFCNGGNGGKAGSGGDAYTNAIANSMVKNNSESGRVGVKGTAGGAGKGNGNDFWSATNDRWGSSGGKGSDGQSKYDGPSADVIENTNQGGSGTDKEKEEPNAPIL